MLSTSLSSSATAASDLEARLAAAESTIAALQRISPSVPSQAGGGYRQVIDVRDYSVFPDSGKDATSAIMRACADAAKPGNPVTVWVPAGVWTCGPLVIPSGVLQGEGMLGSRINGSRCTILRARDESDIGPALMFAPNQGVQWLQGTTGRNLGIDVSQSRRFLTEAPPPVTSVQGASNCEDFYAMIAWGNRGTALEVRPNPLVGNAVSENLNFVRCGCYGGYLAQGGVASWKPAGPLMVSMGDNIRFHGGLFAYGYGNGTIPVSENMSENQPGVLFSPIVDSAGIHPGSGALLGTAITNMVVGVRVAVVEFGNRVYGPDGILIDGIAVENWNTAFHLGAGVADSFRTYGTLRGYGCCPNIRITGTRIGGNNSWYGPSPAEDPQDKRRPRQVLADNMQGGVIELGFMGAPGGRMEGDVTLGLNCTGVTCRVGPNPNGNAPRGVDVSGRNHFEYL